MAADDRGRLPSHVDAKRHEDRAYSQPITPPPMTASDLGCDPFAEMFGIEGVDIVEGNFSGRFGLSR